MLKESMATHHLSISQRYLNRIGFEGDISLTLETLNNLLDLHTRTIPFGNIDAFLNQGVSVEIEDIAAKLIDKQREGYCFEHNLLTQHVLQELGFECFNLLCRVYYMHQPDKTPAQTHLITIVKLNRQLYLFDPGFGGATPTQVLALGELNTPQHTPLGPYRLIDVADSGVDISALTGMKYMLQTCIKAQWVNVYAFNPAFPAAASDVMLANWYISTSAKSVFTQNVMFSIIHQGQRTNMNNRMLKTYAKDQIFETVLPDEASYKQCLQQIFQVHIKDDELLHLNKKLNSKDKRP